MFAVGFTGTREGMTQLQLTACRGVLEGFPRPFRFHHGRCWGADAEAHTIARSLGARIIGHPSNVPGMDAGCECDYTLPPMDPLERNRIIVLASNVLVAAPAQMEEQRRSGTWATIRYARKEDVQIYYVLPDGTVLDPNAC